MFHNIQIFGFQWCNIIYIVTNILLLQFLHLSNGYSVTRNTQELKILHFKYKLRYTINQGQAMKLQREFTII